MRPYKKTGFSLIEIMVSVGIIAVLAMLIVQTYIATIRNNTKTEVMKDLKQNGDYALSVISRMIQSANSIISCTANTLVIDDKRGNTTTFRAELSDSCRIASISAVGTVYLTNSNISLDGATCSNNVQFSCTDISGSPSRASIKFGLRQKNTSASNFESASMVFQTNVTMRNLSY